MTEVVQPLTLGSLEANMPESAVVGPHTEGLFVDVVDVLDHAGGGQTRPRGHVWACQGTRMCQDPR